jgi:ferredoxin--NADP+ reductase
VTPTHADPTHPFRVAVVGSGPAGVYTADALVRNHELVEVDVFDRLPTPYGLVRYGVAPDHPRIKAIQSALQRTLEHERVRFLGDVAIGTQVTPDELDGWYDAVVYATGASRDRRLGIPGENLANSCSAAELVAWYSGHPDSHDGFSLDAESVVVVGAGNVALDVARLLAKPVDLLHDTDMPTAVLARLAASRVTDVHVVCRRGPEDVRFTAKELRELGELQGVGTEIHVDVPDADGHPPLVAANLRELRALADREVSDRVRTVHFHFWRSPRAVLGSTSVEAVELDVVGVEGGVETIEAGLLVRSVGHLSAPVVTLPYDEALGRVPNIDGRVVDGDGRLLPRRYVAGWVKRGPSGVVGTNRACAADTVALVLADLVDVAPRSLSTTEVDAALASRGVRPVSYAGWLGIDETERARGEELGRARTKIPDWQALRAAVNV